MKIAILSFYSGKIERGVERWTKELAERLSEKHQVVVYQNWPAGEKTGYKTKSVGLNFDIDKKYKRDPLFWRFFLDYKSRKKAVFTLKLLPDLFRENVDIIIPTDGGWQPAFIRFLTWLRGGKMVIVGHSGIGWDDLNNLYSFPDCFVALSTYAKNWAAKRNPFVKTKYIPDGVNLEKFRPEGPDLDVGFEKPIVFCAAALIPSKRIELTIEAVAKAGYSLLIAGSGELDRKLRNLAEEKLGKRFKITRFEFDEMPKAYRATGAFTVASEAYFSFEMVLLEAMASGVPVVANNDPIRREIVGDAGILVDPTDTDAYADALRKALETEWGNKPRKQAEKFSWDKIVEKYDKLFQNLARDK